MPNETTVPPLSGISIELDCAPMTPRPDTYIGRVLKDTPLTVSDFYLHIGPVSFGNWEYKLHAGKEETYLQHKETYGQRITELYNNGNIRYGSW